MLTVFETISQTGQGSLNNKPTNWGLLATNFPADMMQNIMLGSHVGLALDAMEKAGVLSFMIPGFDDVAALKDSAPKRRYKDLWDHTKKVVAQSHSSVVIRWAAFFHDFGKPDTFKMENGVVSFHGHEHLSVKFFKSFANTWNKDRKLFTKDQFDEICFLIYNLGYVEGYESNWTESAIRRFAKDTFPYTENLLLLSSADITTSYPNKKLKILDKINELRTRIEDVRAKDAIIPPLPKGIGNAIIDLGIGPGPVVGTVKDLLETEIKTGKLQAHQALDYYINYIQDNNYFGHK